MATPSKLTHPPIVEALFDLQAVVPPHVAIGRIEDAARSVEDALPMREPLFGATVSVSRGRRGAAEAGVAGSAQHGVLCRSADGREIAQFRRDGFTFNRLEPYPSWEELIPRAMRCWRAFVEKAEIPSTSRVGVRFINRIPIGSGAVRLGDYLNVRPTGFPGGSARPVGFLNQVWIQYPEADAMASITVSVQPSAAPEPLHALVDIDAYELGDGEIPLDQIEPGFERLRRLKNEIFFTVVTDKALEPFR